MILVFLTVLNFFCIICC